MRIVQLTDCHLMADPQAELKGICTRARFDQVLAAIQGYSSTADRLIVTGDLTHDEQLVTYQTLRHLLGEWFPKLRVIPGNHDDRALMRQVFDERIQVVGDRNIFVESLGTWKLIGLDSHVPGHIHGELGSAQREWLEGELATARDSFCGLFLHHPPVMVNSRWLDDVPLVDRAEFLSLVARYPQVRLICCGHIHQERTAIERGIPIFTTPSTGVQFRPETQILEVDSAAPGFRILDLAEDGAIHTRVQRVLLTN